MNSIQKLLVHGQSIWLDYISRGMLSDGGLKRLVDDGVRGVTSNPSIFQKSICETTDYEPAIASITKKDPSIGIEALYEILVIEDIQKAADILRPVYDETEGEDGYVSLEVSPHLASNTEKTISEAQRLWKLVNRPNLMIKVPATPEGIPAIEFLISTGINVNATLIFSMKQYVAVAYAYILGLEANPHPDKVASVASFFVSRIDTAVDKALEKVGTPESLALKGKTAIASAKAIYERFGQIFYSETFDNLSGLNAKVQRPLWASTGTKNPKYSDVLYVEELVGPDTVNTVPMPTLKAFQDHGKARQSLFEDVEDSIADLQKLAEFKIDIDSINDQLLKEGLVAFVQAYDQILESLQGRCKIS